MNIKLKDNSPVSEVKLQARCREIQELVDAGKCTLIDLLDETERRKPHGRPEEDRIFKDTGDGIHTGNYVGLFEYRGGGKVETVVIGDRFGPEETAEDGFLSFFSWAMLEKCWDRTPLWMLEEARARPDTSIFDRLLLLHLAAQLDRAWKKGQLRSYRTFPRYDSRVRGQLDLPRKIRMSMGLEDGSMAYQVREYSEDNIYNRLFLQACLEAEKRQPELMRRLKQKMPGFRMARQGLERQNTAWNRLDTRTLLNGTRKKITNPIYRDYEKLRNVARAVLRRSESGYPGAENGVPFVTGIFLDISKLWEDYLDKAVFSGLSRRPLTQGDGGKDIPILDKLLYIRPDFWWKAEKWVLDAKYRPVWGKTLTKELLKKDERDDIRDDVYQVLSYMLALNCSRGGVIFPVKSEGSAAHHTVSDLMRRDFWLIPFNVPQATDYGAFCGAMEGEVGNVRKEVERFHK